MQVSMPIIMDYLELEYSEQTSPINYGLRLKSETFKAINLLSNTQLHKIRII